MNAITMDILGFCTLNLVLYFSIYLIIALRLARAVILNYGMEDLNGFADNYVSSTKRAPLKPYQHLLRHIFWPWTAFKTWFYTSIVIDFISSEEHSREFYKNPLKLLKSHPCIDVREYGFKIYAWDYLFNKNENTNSGAK